MRRGIARAISSSAKKWTSDIDEVCNEETPIKRRRMAIRTTRNFTPPYEIGRLIETVKTTKNPEVQTMILESLGWRNCSYQSAKIAEFAKQVSEDSNYAPEVRNEALKTYNRTKSNKD